LKATLILQRRTKEKN